MDPLHGRSSDHSPQPQHFFKIVFEENIREGKLGIPSEFAKEYGNTLSSPVFLKVPTGAVWEVELTKRHGIFWLESGWKKFAEHYSLKHGSFLVFRYEGSSHFSVLIFDRSASEIKYPCANDIVQIQQQEVKIEQSEEDDSVLIIDDISPGRRKKPKLRCLRPSKTRRTNPSDKTTICIVRQLNSDEKSKVLQRAGFNSSNPYFMVVMRPTHVGLGCGGNHSLDIPADFARKHFLKDHGDVILCNSDGKTWSAKYFTRLGPNGLPYLKLSWTTFARDNNLKVGDICAFELINCTNISFKVYIDRGQKAAFQGSPASTSIQTARAIKSENRFQGSRPFTSIQTARAFKSENPICVVKLYSSYIHSHALSIPEEFARTYFPKTLRTADVTLCLNGKSWPVEYHQKRTGRANALICRGWREFVQDNKLQVGDICVLEMTNENSKICFNVFIYHDIEDADGYPSVSQVIRRPKRLHSSQAPKRPIFKTVVRTSHLKEKRVDMPFKIFEQYFKPGIQMVKLEVADRLWAVRIASNSCYRLAKLTSGWDEFARDNDLAEGDVCFYHLDTERKDLLKVSISRGGH